MRISLQYALRKGTIGRAVEIGVFKGANAEEMLKAGIEDLVLVDPYMPYKVWGFHGRMPLEDHLEVTQEEQNKIKKDMFNRLAPYGDKIRMLNVTSEQAAGLFPDGYFDYGYIDGNHKYEYVKKDVELWFPKIRKGGMLAGHDFNKPHLGVAKAVREFAFTNDLKVHIIKQGQRDWLQNTGISDWWINCE
jgi:hypothetical protein